MSQNVRLYEIAKEAKVSPATVSRVFMNKDCVRDETRKQVLSAAKSLGYEVKNNKQPEKDSRFIALFVGDIRNPFFSDMIFLLQEEFLKYDYVVVPFSNQFDREKEKRLFEQMRRDDYAAVVLFSSMDTETLEHIIDGLKCPVTLTDRVIDGFKGNVVIQDNFQAGYIATKHLIDLGYHQITFLAGNKTSASSVSRVEGYKLALKNAFLPVEEDLIMYGEMSIRRGYEDGLKYIEKLEDLPRAVITANDMTGIGFLEACKERHISVPNDISIVSFDGIDLSGLKSINLTTVRQPIEEMARQICKLTVQSIENPEVTRNNRVLLEPSLIIRGSACKNNRVN
ncbi:MAG: LacI family DNA-binding transcriptional regulator [Parasporobacterium sp.]|nr:LacI family DNA-binding transcriptional regulator [Parasporobacterium sp.]